MADRAPDFKKTILAEVHDFLGAAFAGLAGQRRIIWGSAYICPPSLVTSLPRDFHLDDKLTDVIGFATSQARVLRMMEGLSP